MENLRALGTNVTSAQSLILLPNKFAPAYERNSIKSLKSWSYQKQKVLKYTQVIRGCFWDADKCLQLINIIKSTNGPRTGPPAIYIYLLREPQLKWNCAKYILTNESYKMLFENLIVRSVVEFQKLKSF